MGTGAWKLCFEKQVIKCTYRWRPVLVCLRFLPGYFGLVPDIAENLPVAGPMFPENEHEVAGDPPDLSTRLQRIGPGEIGLLDFLPHDLSVPHLAGSGIIRST